MASYYSESRGAAAAFTHHRIGEKKTYEQRNGLSRTDISGLVDRGQ